MAIDLREEIKIDIIKHELLQRKQVQLGILRLDQIHPVVSGNKWFKLKENLKAAQESGCTTLLTFGGAWSNHLLATAAAAKAFGLGSTGMVRGFHGRENPTETLKECKALGMNLLYISREDYNKKDDPLFLTDIQSRYLGAYIIPEGGDNGNGIKGAGEIASYIPHDMDCVMLPVGTGTTFAGIRNQLNTSIRMLGFPAMKGGMYLKEEIGQKLNIHTDNWQLNADYHFGGFAKHNETLVDFMDHFYMMHKVPLDVVYTSKMMYGVFDLLQKDHFPSGTKLLCIHTGGLQGNGAVSQYLQYS